MPGLLEGYKTLYHQLQRIELTSNCALPHTSLPTSYRQDLFDIGYASLCGTRPSRDLRRCSLPGETLLI